MPKTNELSKSVKDSSAQAPLFANETAIVLNKESNELTIRAYFEGILKLSESVEDFPVNLDDVWALAYSEKGKAVRALKTYFIEGIDYQSFAKNGKREIGGTVIHVYMLSVPCLEYFIARKVRPVFEVYRKVFHKTAKPKQLIESEEVKKLKTELHQERMLKKSLQEELYQARGRLELRTEQLNSEMALKNSCFSFLVLHRMYNRWKQYDEESKLKEVVRRLKKEDYELPF